MKAPNNCAENKEGNPKTHENNPYPKWRRPKQFQL